MPIPSCTGPFKVGCVDVMTKVRSLPIDLDLSTICKTDLGSFARIFYPCDGNTSNYKLAKWMPEPHQSMYSSGILKHIKTGSSLVGWLMHSFTKNITMDAFENAPIIDHIEWKKKQRMTCIKDRSKLPVIVFSHGLAGQRAMYSTFCTQLASEGFVVAAVEHRDTSASCTYVVDVDENVTEIPYTVLDTKDDANPEREQLRETQLLKRTQEISKVLDLLESLNEEPEKITLSTTFDLTYFKKRLDTENVFMMGHSFGGATTVNALKNDQRLRGGIGLDVWFVPLPENFYERSEKTEKPVLLINTEFFNWKKNLKRCVKYMDNTSRDMIELITLRGTDHYYQCDVPGIVPTFLHPWLEKKVPFRLPYAEGIDMQRQIIYDFLTKYFQTQESQPVHLLDATYKLADVFIEGSNIKLDESNEEVTKNKENTSS